MFVVAPTLLAVFMRGYLIFPAIWSLAAICLVVLLRDPTFDRAQLWNARRVFVGLPGVIIMFTVLAVVLAVGLVLYEPERLLSLPRQNPVTWMMIMLLYPLLSVYPQEIAFRAYFVHRYGPLMNRVTLIAACAVAFGYAHIILHNWFAVAACTVGGVLFTITYVRSRSLLAASLEHAIYGCFLFTIGWGWYLYHGSIGQ